MVNAITLPRFDAQAPTYVSEGSDVGVGPDETTGATVGAVLDIDAYAPGSGVADAGIAYAIEGGNLNGAFAIDEAGLITIANPYVIDFETTTTYYLSVRATDSAGRSNTITVEVNVEDVLTQRRQVQELSPQRSQRTISSPKRVSILVRSWRVKSGSYRRRR